MRTLKSENNSGIILVVVMWIILIISLAAVGLGRRSRIELELAKYRLGRAQAQFAAWAGFMWALEQIRLDNKDPQTKQKDTAFQCGFVLDTGQAPEDIFKEQSVGNGLFSLIVDPKPNDSVLQYGLSDEERRINLNGLTLKNLNVLVHLISLGGYSLDQANQIAAAILDWKDLDGKVSRENLGAEDDYYSSLTPGYHCKNQPFDAIEELLLIKGVDKGIYTYVKDYVTVFPKEGKLKINFETASEVVLKALARSVSGSKTNTETSDADSLVEKIIIFRNGDDGQSGTQDDRAIELSELVVNEKERVIFLMMEQTRTKISKSLRIHSRGEDTISGATSQIDAVVRREDLSLLYWHRN